MILKISKFKEGNFGCKKYGCKNVGAKKLAQFFVLVSGIKKFLIFKRLLFFFFFISFNLSLYLFLYNIKFDF